MQSTHTFKQGKVSRTPDRHSGYTAWPWRSDMLKQLLQDDIRMASVWSSAAPPSPERVPLSSSEQHV